MKITDVDENNTQDIEILLSYLNDGIQANMFSFLDDKQL